VDPEQGQHKPEAPGHSVWPIGLAVGIAALLVGLVVSWWIVAIGGAIALVFAFLWFADLSGNPVVERPEGGGPEPAAGPPSAARRETVPGGSSRQGFLVGSTLALGGVIGALVSIPPVFLALIPPFLKQSKKPVDLGPISQWPENQWKVTTFVLVPSDGQVSRRTVYIRYNGLLGKSPSFTIITNRCAHLGCPVQPLGLLTGTPKTINTTPGETVTTQEVLAVSGFSCPCHGGAYDTEGNRTAGPPVKGLDRYEFSIVHGHLILGKMYSVSHVVGSGASAQIHKYDLYGPGQHVDGLEQILYPLTPPS
jgi:Rieske Fe-S protein